MYFYGKNEKKKNPYPTCLFFKLLSKTHFYVWPSLHMYVCVFVYVWPSLHMYVCVFVYVWPSLHMYVCVFVSAIPGTV